MYDTVAESNCAVMLTFSLSSGPHGPKAHVPRRAVRRIARPRGDPVAVAVRSVAEVGAALDDFRLTLFRSSRIEV